MDDASCAHVRVPFRRVDPLGTTRETCWPQALPRFPRRCIESHPGQGHSDSSGPIRGWNPTYGCGTVPEFDRLPPLARDSLRRHRRLVARCPARRTASVQANPLRAAHVRQRRRSPAVPQAAARRGLPPVRQVRLQRGRGRAHHRPRPRVRPDHFWVNPFAVDFSLIKASDLILRQPRRRGRRGRLRREPRRLRHPLAGARGPARRAGRGPRPLGARQGVLVARPAARSDHAGLVRVLRRPRAVRRLHRRRARHRGGQAHRPRPRREQGRHPAQPRTAHRRPLGRRGRLVVHHHGAHLPGPAAGHGRRHPGAHRPRDGRHDPDPGRRPPRRLAQLPAPLRDRSSTTNPISWSRTAGGGTEWSRSRRETRMGEARPSGARDQRA